VNEINKLVGERIATIRKYNRINQADLAEKLGKSLRTVQKYESGEIDIPLSTLAEVAEILNTTLNYLLGYDTSHIKAETLSDVLEFFFEIDRKNELSFNMDIKKAGRDGKWECAFIFNGQDESALYNADFCKVMETFSINRESLKTYWMDYEAYRAWQKAKIEYYSKCTLSDKEYEELDRTTFIMRRNEIDRQNLQKKLEEERELNSGDDEQ
jgi:transcriptional regulator with XRE-family HTH domain